MSVSTLNTGLRPLPPQFTQALEGFASGFIGCDFLRRALVRALEEDFECADTLQATLDEAYHDGRLSDEDYELLRGDLERLVAEDAPTDWSDAVTSETGPESDTVGQGKSRADEAPAEPAARAPRRLYPGAVLRERFVLQSRVRASAMGEIYKALDRRREEAGAPDPHVALKAIGPAFPRFADGVKLLQQEAALAQRLTHPNIARVFDFDRDGDEVFITVEWLEGESLAELLTRQRYRPLNPQRAGQIIVEIGEALAHAHSRGVVHADVKPGNIFLAANGQSKLLDFGAARTAGPHAAGETPQAWTPAYASCEVLEGQEPSPQDDLFSLACVAYRMLAGRRAFGRQTALEAERAARAPARIAHLSERQWSALERALAFRRADRTGSVMTFLQEFQSAVRAAAPVTALPPTQRATPPSTQYAALPPTQHAAPSAAARSRTRMRFAVAGGLVAVTVTILLTGGPETSVAPEPPASPTPEKPAGDPLVPVALAAPAADPETPTAQPVPTAATASSPPPVNSRPAVQRRPTATPARRQAQVDAARRSRPAPAGGPPAVSAPARQPPVVSASATPPATPVQTETPAPAVVTNSRFADIQPAQLTQPMESPGERAMSTPESVAAVPAGVPSLPVAEAAGASAQPALEVVPLSTLKFTRYVEPEFQTRGRAAQAGWVTVRFRVDADGRPADIAVVDADPRGRYEDAALAAVRRWRFEPVTENGQAVERETRVRLRFEP